MNKDAKKARQSLADLKKRLERPVAATPDQHALYLKKALEQADRLRLESMLAESEFQIERNNLQARIRLLETEVADLNMAAASIYKRRLREAMAALEKSNPRKHKRLREKFAAEPEPRPLGARVTGVIKSAALEAMKRLYVTTGADIARELGVSKGHARRTLNLLVGCGHLVSIPGADGNGGYPGYFALVGVELERKINPWQLPLSERVGLALSGRGWSTAEDVVVSIFDLPRPVPSKHRRRTAVYEALRWLRRCGFVARKSQGQSSLYILTAAGQRKYGPK